MIKRKIKILLPLLFILSNSFYCQTFNSILKISFLRMDSPNSATLRITVTLGKDWYNTKIIVKDRGEEKVIWERSLMEENETINVEYQVNNLEIDSLVKITAWAEFEVPEDRGRPLLTMDERYLLSKGDEILHSFDYSYVNYFE